MQADEENGAVQFIDESHKHGFFDYAQSTKKGNVLSDERDMLISKDWQKKIFQSELMPGQCTFHDGKISYFNDIFIQN